MIWSLVITFEKLILDFGIKTINKAYINEIDMDYDSEDSILTRVSYELDTLVFNEVNRLRYGNSVDFKRQVIEYEG